MKAKKKILIVDDDTTFIDLAVSVLKGENYSVQSVNNAEDAMKKITKTVFDIVITDIILPGTDGLKLLEKVKSQSPSTDVIFCTNYSGVESAVQALKAGVFDYLIKPVKDDVIRVSVRRCMDQREIYAENEDLKKTVELIEVCKNISTTFNRDKIAKYSLDILMKETGASAGLFMAYENDDKKNLETILFKGIGPKKSTPLTEHFSQMVKKWKKKKETLFNLDEEELNMARNHFKTLKDCIIIKINVKSETKAYIILLSGTKDGDFTKERIKHTSFIIRETALAFNNLDQYMGAKELAYIDDLTNLYNSRYLYLILDREIKRSKRFKSTLVVLFIDLDKFKAINDAHGHLVGGKVLIEMADVLLKCVREIDTVVRYGGDEYIVVLTDTDVKSGRMVAERIRSAIEKHIFLKKENLKIKLTACIGLAAFPKHASTKKELIHFADMAMYMGKETTKNAVYIAAERLIK
jgi:diguanylate cyclase (GGDEF)-like protein